MSTPFSPQLIGQTQKALGALLRRFLEGTGLTHRLRAVLASSSFTAVSADNG